MIRKKQLKIPLSKKLKKNPRSLPLKGKVLSGKARRNKGSNYERQIRNEVIALGYTKAVTSRSESRNADDKGIDILYVNGFGIQCKRTEIQPNFAKVLTSMSEDYGLRVIFHKKNNKPDTVTMLKEDFYKLINKKEYESKL